MTSKELRTEALKIYYPALFLERIFPRRQRTRMIRAGWLLVVVSFVALLIIHSLSRFYIHSIFGVILPRVYGVFFVCLSLWMFSMSVQAFYNSFYYKDIPDDEHDRPLIPFAIARILYRSPAEDMTSGFLASHEGKLIMLRAGISPEDVAIYLEHRTVLLASEALLIELPKMISIYI